MRSIFNETQSVRFRERAQSVHVGGNTGVMDGQYRLCPGRDLLSCVIRIHRRILETVDIDEDSFRSALKNSGCSCDKCHGRTKDFVTRSDIQCLEREEQSSCPVGHGYGVAGTGEFGESLLKGLRARSSSYPR